MTKQTDEWWKARWGGGRLLNKPLSPRLKQEYGEQRGSRARQRRRDRVEEYLETKLKSGKTEFLAVDVAKDLNMTNRQAGRILCDILTENEVENSTGTRWNKAIGFNTRVRRVKNGIAVVGDH